MHVVLKNGTEKDVTVTWRFSCHCYSRTPRESEMFAEERIVWDHKRLRLFSIRRYEFSVRLPEIVRALPSKTVYKTQYHNMVHVTLAEGEDYAVFFTLRRNGDGVLAFIESAYPVDEVKRIEKSGKPMRFATAVAKAFERTL